MHVGGDYHNIAGGDITSKQNLEYNLRHGVKRLTAEISKNPEGAWDPDELQRMKDNCDKYGVVFEAIRMNSRYINLLRKGPKRGREIDIIVGNIRKAAQIGVRIITYHCEVIPYRRNGKTTGRGGTTCDSFKLEDDWKNVPMGDEGRVTYGDYWERITYFLEEIIPAAKEYDVRMACHPADPPGLPFGYQGVDEWDSPAIFEAIKRYESIVDSPYNGFQLDLGNASAGLRIRRPKCCRSSNTSANGEKYIRYTCVTFVAVLTISTKSFPMKEKWTFQKLCESRDTQFSGSICPDHMPSHPDDPGGFQAFAFSY